MGIIGNNQIVKSDNEQLLNAPYGMQGADVITDTADHVGNWYCIMSLEDNTTLDASSCAVNWTLNGAAFTLDMDLITGVPYYGDWRTISLEDGKVIAYKK